MHTRVIDNCCITLAQRLEYQLATILYLVHSRKRPLKIRTRGIILLRLKTGISQFRGLHRSLSGAAACGKRTEHRGRYQESIHFILGLTRHIGSTTSGIGRVRYC